MKFFLKKIKFIMKFIIDIPYFIGTYRPSERTLRVKKWNKIVSDKEHSKRFRFFRRQVKTGTLTGKKVNPCIET